MSKCWSPSQITELVNDLRILVTRPPAAASKVLV